VCVFVHGHGQAHDVRATSNAATLHVDLAVVSPSPVHCAVPFQARELKSVYVNADAAFLKLVVHECHSNKYNDRNQVSVIAVNVLGTVLSGHGLDAPGVQPPGA
jgi:hypothetical protein